MDDFPLDLDNNYGPNNSYDPGPAALIAMLIIVAFILGAVIF